jgi:hypothetical protein
MGPLPPVPLPPVPLPPPGVVVVPPVALPATAAEPAVVAAPPEPAWGVVVPGVPPFDVVPPAPLPFESVLEQDAESKKTAHKKTLDIVILRSALRARDLLFSCSQVASPCS